MLAVKLDHAYIAMVAICPNILGGRSVFAMPTDGTFNIFIRHRLKNLDIDRAVGALAVGADDPCQKLSFGAGGLVSHDTNPK